MWLPLLSVAMVSCELFSSCVFCSVCAETDNGCIFAGSALGKKGKCIPGPSCSKHRKLNKLVSGQNVICSNKYNIQFTGIFC